MAIFVENAKNIRTTEAFFSTKLRTSEPQIGFTTRYTFFLTIFSEHEPQNFRKICLFVCLLVCANLVTYFLLNDWVDFVETL